MRSGWTGAGAGIGGTYVDCDGGGFPPIVEFRAFNRSGCIPGGAAADPAVGGLGIGACCIPFWLRRCLDDEGPVGGWCLSGDGGRWTGSGRTCGMFTGPRAILRPRPRGPSGGLFRSLVDGIELRRPYSGSCMFSLPCSGSPRVEDA
ncbi:hypothetical protein RRF57_010181 [Xylaria bambusicola]|uniref:Uncharacterized protein n=1 Tax=Xylaria bambusicola TaxID=326684 RepID=A0AAN7URV3_9PEZI